MLKVKFNTIASCYAPMSWAMINCFGAIHVIKNEGVDLTVIHVGGNSTEFRLCYGGHILLISGCHKAKELDASFLGDSCGINDGFHRQDDHNFYKKLSSILLKVKFNTTALHYAPMS